MMRRRHWRIGTRLALFAIAAQLAFAFGHLAGPSPLHAEGPLSLVLENLLLHSSYAAHSETEHEHDHEADGDRCNICWLLSAAGALLLPLVAMLAVLLLGQAIARPAEPSGALARHLAVAYLVRAPPVVRCR